MYLHLLLKHMADAYYYDCAIPVLYLEHSFSICVFFYCSLGLMSNLTDLSMSKKNLCHLSSPCMMSSITL